MTRIATLLLSAAILTMGAAVHAQQDQPAERMPSHQDGDSSGTSPGGMSSSGWTGGTGGAHIGTSNSHTTGAAPPPAPSDGQPLTATGEDLNGPPTRFPPNKTPE
jgi:hypothetical protein